MLPKLTPKQARFVTEYLVDLNATQAVLRAGYKMTEAAAATQGGRLLRNAEIQRAIQEARQAQEARTQITADRVLRELARVAFADVTAVTYIEDGHVRLMDSRELTEDQRAAIACAKEGAYGPEVRLHDKMRALELIGRHLGMFDRREDTDSQGVNVTFEAEMEDWSE